MLLRKQKQYTRVGIDISTIIPDDIYLKLLNRIICYISYTIYEFFSTSIHF